ncbi:MAG: hypothetical protein H6993_03125 [Pseudomonadales bacterium]|nr:hypothetical protein [Pseudomonadales bacterium]MCP5182924.1 hypothetical protein [Pseudomonadales bacterium]
MSGIESLAGRVRPGIRAVCVVALLQLLGGCASLVSSAAGGLTDNLSSAILDSEDLELVRDGAPAYLLLMDGMLEGSPRDAGLLAAAAKLNSAYASAFVEESARARRLHDKALNMAERSVCARIPSGCGLRTMAFKQFQSWVAERKARDVPLLYGLGSTWAGWMQVHSDDFNAVAELARVRLLMERLVALDETYDNGGAHLYLGVFDTLFPPAMGGRPDAGRAHFERADAIAGGRSLLVRVMEAENYARLVFDRELHDQLLNSVIEAEPKAPGLTLTNIVAQKRARQLLDTADEYF